jgi:hypothetical protein
VSAILDMSAREVGDLCGTIRLGEKVCVLCIHHADLHTSSTQTPEERSHMSVALKYRCTRHGHVYRLHIGLVLSVNTSGAL